MTLKERVIVETYTGICMTSSEERNEVYKYMQEIMGRPIFTHELAFKNIQEKLREKSKKDFLELCKNKNKNEKTREEIYKLSEEDFLSYVVTLICDYAQTNDYGVTDSVKTIGDNLMALTEICCFDNWKVSGQDA